MQSSVYRPVIMAALSALQASMEFAVVTDKGHLSSGGITVVEFWIGHPVAPDSGVSESLVGASTSNRDGYTSSRCPLPSGLMADGATSIKREIL